jgi:hypothetical protein
LPQAKLRYTNECTNTLSGRLALPTPCPGIRPLATPDERASLLKEADGLVDKAKEIKQKKMETRAKS